MALHFDLTRVNPLTKRDGVTDTLIFATMIVGMGEITEKNAAEFWDRLDLIQHLNGPLMDGTDSEGKSTPVAVTFEDVQNHIGLRTNVALETWAKFLKRNVDGWKQSRQWKRSHAAQEV